MPQTRPVSVGNANTIRTPLPMPQRGGVSPSPGGGAEPDCKVREGDKAHGAGRRMPVHPLLRSPFLCCPINRCRGGGRTAVRKTSRLVRCISCLVSLAFALAGRCEPFPRGGAQLGMKDPGGC